MGNRHRWSTADCKAAVSALPAKRRVKWEQFRAAVAAADSAGRVWWALGRGAHQHKNPFLELLLDGVETQRGFAGRYGDLILVPALDRPPVRLDPHLTASPCPACPPRPHLAVKDMLSGERYRALREVMAPRSMSPWRRQGPGRTALYPKFTSGKALGAGV